jgi:hypothetical protein
MARLGELLVESGLLTPEQVEQGLRAQVVWGGRLGTNLVELKLLDLDMVTRFLGRLHGLPAALARHFEHADPELQRRFPADLASALSVIPLVHLADGQIAVASIDPLDVAAHGTIADILGIAPEQLVVSIGAELRIRYHLERVYDVPRPARFLRARGPSSPPFPKFTDLDDSPETDPDAQLPPPGVPDPAPRAIEREQTPTQLPAEDLAVMIDAAVAAVTAPASADDSDAAGRERRRYVSTLADEPNEKRDELTESQVLARMPLRKVAQRTPTQGVKVIEGDRGPGETLDDATRAIRRARHRDRVAELVIAAVERHAKECEAAIVLVVRGGTAIGWKWFARTGHTPPDIAVPLDQPGLIPAAIQRNSTVRCVADELQAIDMLLLRALGKSEGDLAVVPVAIAHRVMCLIAVAVPPACSVAPVEAIGAAAGTGFARLIQNASR